MNIFDQLYEVPDEDEHLEPDFSVEPNWWLEPDLISNCID